MKKIVIRMYEDNMIINAHDGVTVDDAVNTVVVMLRRLVAMKDEVEPEYRREVAEKLTEFAREL